MLTQSPTATSDSSEVFSAMLTTCRSVVPDSTGPAAGLPRLPGTLVTRIASGSNTTDFAASDPDGLEIPTADCSASTAAFVSHEK